MSLLQCYNRGCGQKYDNASNSDDACTHHPGEPFFHDAYKGWSCCKKKCIDFTEFLNIKGCTVSKHSNEKLPEPEKPATAGLPDEVIEVKPIVRSVLKRPPFNAPLVRMVPEVAASLLADKTTGPNQPTGKPSDPDEIVVGTTCKNPGCATSYQGPETNATACVHHSGTPIFHEGMKFWSCCQKRTTDFNAFLNQVGCQRGKHLWRKQDDENSKVVQCRWDYHQTGSFVVVSIYAKQYCPKSSTVQLNPIRLAANLVFPQQNDAVFKLDVELKGIVNVEESKVSMYGTKVEIKLKKAEAGSWNRLDVPRTASERLSSTESQAVVDSLAPQIDAVDLSSL